MENAKNLLLSFSEQIQKIIIEFEYNEKNGAKLLPEFKETLGKKYDVEEEAAELFSACIYNVLATINSVPTQNIKSDQLTAALGEARGEIEAIAELL